MYYDEEVHIPPFPLCTPIPLCLVRFQRNFAWFLMHYKDTCNMKKRRSSKLEYICAKIQKNSNDDNKFLNGFILVVKFT